MGARELTQTEIIGWLADRGSDFVDVGILFDQTAQNGFEHWRLFEIVIRNAHRAEFTEFRYGAFEFFGGFDFEIDEAGTSAQSIFEKFDLTIERTLEATRGAVMTTGGENLGIGIAVAEFAENFDASGGIGQVVQAKLGERTAVFVFALGCIIQLAARRQTQCHADTGQGSGQRGH